MGAPVELAAGVAEDGARGDEVAASSTCRPGLLERFAHGALDEVLAGLDAAARRPPDVGGEVRLADQREPSRRIEDEERHVVRARGVVRRDRPLALGDLTVPRRARPARRTARAAARAPRRRRALELPQELEELPVEPSTSSACSRELVGDSVASTATRTRCSSSRRRGTHRGRSCRRPRRARASARLRQQMPHRRSLVRADRRQHLEHLAAEARDEPFVARALGDRLAARARPPPRLRAARKWNATDSPFSSISDGGHAAAPAKSAIRAASDPPARSSSSPCEPT